MTADKTISAENGKLGHARLRTTAANKTERMTRIDAVSLDFAPNKRACCNHGTLTDDGAVQQNGPGSDPNIIFDNDSTPTRLKALFHNRYIRPFEFVISRRQGTVCRYENVFADAHAVPRINDTAGIDLCTLRDGHVAQSAYRLDLDERIDHHTRAND